MPPRPHLTLVHGCSLVQVASHPVILTLPPVQVASHPFLRELLVMQVLMQGSCSGRVTVAQGQQG